MPAPASPADLLAQAAIPASLQPYEDPAAFRELLAALRAGDPSPAVPAPATLLPAQITLPDDARVATLVRCEAHTSGSARTGTPADVTPAGNWLRPPIRRPVERQLVRAYNLLERVQRRRRAQEVLSPAADPACPDAREGARGEHDSAEPGQTHPDP